MKASFLPTTTYSIKAVYEAGWPSPPALFEPEAGQRMMAEMLEQAECAEEVGFDWISFSEHHYAPLLLPTPNPALFAAAEPAFAEGENRAVRTGSAPAQPYPCG